MEWNKFYKTMKNIIDIDDFDAVLNQYRGAYTQIWLFNVSLKRIVLRLTNGNNNALYIVGITCRHIVSSFSWKSSNITIYKMKNADEGEDTIVEDKDSGFKLICGGVSLVDGPANELHNSFSEFLSDINY